MPPPHWDPLVTIQNKMWNLCFSYTFFQCSPPCFFAGYISPFISKWIAIMTVIIRPRMSRSELFRSWIFLPLYQVVNSIGFPSTDLSGGRAIQSLSLLVSIANRLNLSRPRDQKKRRALETRKKFDHHMFQTPFAFGFAHVKFAQA